MPGQRVSPEPGGQARGSVPTGQGCPSCPAQIIPGNVERIENLGTHPLAKIKDAQKDVVSLNRLAGSAGGSGRLLESTLRRGVRWTWRC